MPGRGWSRNPPHPETQNDINKFTSVVDDGGLNPRAVSLDNEEGLWQSSSAIPASASNHVIVYMLYPLQPRRLHSVQLGVKTFLALLHGPLKLHPCIKAASIRTGSCVVQNNFLLSFPL